MSTYLPSLEARLASASERFLGVRYLGGVTVSIGNARGYQAVSYYQSGRIVISPTHRASLQRILSHEIWHIIDWRDNGRIDWRESIPPANTSTARAVGPIRDHPAANGNERPPWIGRGAITRCRAIATEDLLLPILAGTQHQTRRR